MKPDTALIVVDMQIGVFADACQSERVLATVATLLNKARTNGIPVIYIQHNDKWLKKGTPEWRIHPAVAPQSDEPVIHKQHTDAFHETTLQETLQKLGIRNLIVVGGQTEYCVGALVRRAMTFDYHITLVSDAHTTLDDGDWKAEQIIAYHNHILDGYNNERYSTHVQPAASIVF